MSKRLIQVLVVASIILGSNSFIAYSNETSGIVFWGKSDSDESFSIYKVNPDGSNLQKLTNGFVDARDPSWSPNHKRIVFTASDSQSSDIYTMNSDGSNLLRVTNDSDWEWSPSWSPDGKRIVFAKNKNRMPQLFVVNSDGTNETQLTRFEGTNDKWVPDLSPKWSPNGKQIAFWRSPNSDKSLPSDIYVIDSNGNNLRQLTNNGAYSFFPTWTPNGRQLVFSINGFGEVQLYIINNDGSNQRKLLTSEIFKFQSSISQNGKSIAFTGDAKDGKSGIYVSNLDGSREIKITNSLQLAFSPNWN